MSGILAFGVPGSNDTLSMDFSVELYHSDLKIQQTYHRFENKENEIVIMTRNEMIQEKAIDVAFVPFTITTTIISIL